MFLFCKISSVFKNFCQFELVLKMQVTIMNVEDAGREENCFVEWEGVFLLLLSVLLFIIRFMECVFYKIYVICFAVTCVKLSCMPKILF